MLEGKDPCHAAARSLPEWRSKYVHLTMRRGRKIAKVAMARKLAVRLYWMMRKEWDYEQLKKFGSQGRKIRLSRWSGQCFHPVPEAAKFPNHSISAPASGLGIHCRASFFVTYTLVQNDPNQATKSMGNGPDGLIVS
jgi:hypothetical protein